MQITSTNETIQHIYSQFINIVVPEAFTKALPLSIGDTAELCLGKTGPKVDTDAFYD